MVTQRAYKFRIYPDAAQVKHLAVEFGNARFVWNRCLDLRTKAYEADKTRHNYVSLGRQVTDEANQRLALPELPPRRGPSLGTNARPVMAIKMRADDGARFDGVAPARGWRRKPAVEMQILSSA